MKITKTQIDYLDRRLTDILRDKLSVFQKANPKQTDDQYWEAIYTGIKSGKIKLRSKKEVMSIESKWHTPSLSNLFDLSSVEDTNKDIVKLYDEYENKLRKAKTEIMDKVVLSDLMIEEAVAEFKKL